MQTVSHSVRPPGPPGAERRFFLAMSIAILAAVFLGFSRSFYLHPLFPEREAPAEVFFAVHGVVFSAWFVLLVVQVALIRAGRRGLHRRIGAFAFANAVAMLVLGVYGTLIAAARPTGFIGVGADSRSFALIPLVDMLNFGVFIAIAWFSRTRPQAHKRLVLLASMSLLTAAIGRWPGLDSAGVLAYYAITDLFLVALAAWDLASLRRLHGVTLWGGAWLVLTQPVRLLLAKSAPWLAASGWILDHMR